MGVLIKKSGDGTKERGETLEYSNQTLFWFGNKGNGFVGLRRDTAKQEKTQARAQGQGTSKRVERSHRR